MIKSSPIAAVIGTGLIGAFVFQFCSPATDLSSTLSAVAPPFESVDVPGESFSLDPAEAHVLHLNNGTVLRIPVHVFVDGNGQPVTGDVDLNFRQFHTPAEVISCGITMDYDSAGTTYPFITAGMFDISATAQGEEVFIAEGKTIDVELASHRDDATYNFYGLEESESRWDFLAAENVAPNTAKQAAMAELEEQRPVPPMEPEKFDPNTPVMDLDVNYSAFPELKAFHGVMWQYAEGGPNPDDNEWIFEEEWTDIRLERADADYTFQVNFFNKKKEFSMLVKPAITQAQYAEAKAEFDNMLADYSETLVEIEAELDRLQGEANLVRAFGIKRMGIYNWDCKMKMGNPLQLAANFDFGEMTDTDINKVSVFVISAEDQGVLRFHPTQWDQFFFDIEKTNKIVAILPEDRVAVYRSGDFAKAGFSLEQHNGKPYTFRMDVLPEPVATVNDLSDLLESI